MWDQIWTQRFFFFLFSWQLQEYVMKLEKSHAEQGKTLSYCELNLETWRQLWRVLEISDIILVIVDARYPVNRTVHHSIKTFF